MEPIIAFVNEDGYVEQITGHRRVYACQELDIPNIETLIKKMTRDEATILMGASNLEKRTSILPSEKAATYKAMLDALKRQGKRTDLLTDNSERIERLNSNEELAKIVKESQRTIQHYIRLNYLNPELLQLVDEGRIALKPAVELSYLSNAADVAIDGSKVDFQKLVYDHYVEFDTTPSHAQALKMHKMFKENLLNEEDVKTILSDKKPNQKSKDYKIPDSVIGQFFETDVDVSVVEQTIIKALTMYMKHENIMNKGKSKNSSNVIESEVE